MSDVKKLKELALEVRIAAIEQFKARGFGHVGGSLSVCDLMAVLYGEVMRYDPKNPGWPERDKLVCSKGHAGPAVYAVLAVKGFFPYDEIKTLNQPGTRFPSHCDRKQTIGVDMTTGSLGQGTSLAVGMALGDRLKGRDSRTFLVVGDGELNEGQPWEAAMLAASRGLDNMIWFVDWNKKQLDGTLEEILKPFDFEEKFKAFGFHAQTVNGNDVEALSAAIRRCGSVQGKPHCIVMDTVKGAGVPDVENTVYNHSMNVKPETCDKWLADLRAQLDELRGGETA
ncbi:MAG: transketolase [Clostridiales bacterium]|jgi:transketolase|nr:transketolase [Bacillota bacterium]NLL54002.1 transketolase [Clostridiales bacterium]